MNLVWDEVMLSRERLLLAFLLAVAAGHLTVSVCVYSYKAFTHVSSSGAESRTIDMKKGETRWLSAITTVDNHLVLHSDHLFQRFSSHHCIFKALCGLSRKDLSLRHSCLTNVVTVRWMRQEVYEMGRHPH